VRHTAKHNDDPDVIFMGSATAFLFRHNSLCCELQEATAVVIATGPSAVLLHRNSLDVTSAARV